VSRPHRYHHFCKALAQAERIAASSGLPAAVVELGAGCYEARDLRRARRACAAHPEFTLAQVVGDESEVVA
jgi:hypothetical protein